MKSNALLMLTSFIWGTAFVAQRVGSASVEPFTFNAVRMLLAAIVLTAVIIIIRRQAKKRLSGDEALSPVFTRANVIGGVLCGLILCIASFFQQAGVSETTAGKAGFITALYIVIVPIFGLFMKKTAPLRVWIAVALGVVGLYLLSVSEDFSIGRGELLVLVCALFFSMHIMVIDHFSQKADGVIMSCIQFFVASASASVLMLVLETPRPSEILTAWFPIFYSGVFSGGVGYTLQIIAQKNTTPTLASLLMSFESVFSVLAGALILQEFLSGREITGCILMFAAIILSQLPDRKKKAAE